MNVVGCSRTGLEWKPNGARFQRRRQPLPKSPNSAAPVRRTAAPPPRRSTPFIGRPPRYTPLRKPGPEPNPTRNLDSPAQKLAGEGATTSPLELLEEDGDWSKEQFWAVVEFLKQSSRSDEISEVFDAWTSLDKSRNSRLNYNKIIALLCEVGLVEEALLALEEMKTLGLEIPKEAYNSIIHGYANKGQFEDATLYLNVLEDSGLNPNDETFDGLIAAFGRFRKYDEMVKCLELMKTNGFSPDHITYNILIREFARGGLLTRMERTYQALLSKKMDLQPATLSAMIEAYLSFGMVEKMESLYHKGIRSKKLMISDDLMWKIAEFYIERKMFSRLDDLGSDISSRRGRIRFVWRLKLLCHACMLGKKGMTSVLRDMEESGVSWDPTIANILLRAHLRMKDLRVFEAVLSELPGRNVAPDIVTLGIAFDANGDGFDWSRTVNGWKIYGYLDRYVEMKTDPLVLVAFGKGRFLEVFEEMYATVDDQARKKKWTYRKLIDFVLDHNS